MGKRENNRPATVQELWQQRRRGKPPWTILAGAQRETERAYSDASILEIRAVKDELGELEAKARRFLKANPTLEARYRFELGLYAAQRIILDSIVARRRGLPASSGIEARKQAQEWASGLREYLPTLRSDSRGKLKNVLYCSYLVLSDPKKPREYSVVNRFLEHVREFLIEESYDFQEGVQTDSIRRTLQKHLKESGIGPLEHGRYQILKQALELLAKSGYFESL